MADQTRIQGPVDIRSDSRERVAFDLMERIDYRAEESTKKDEGYYLRLYHRCLKVVNHMAPEDALKLK